MTTSSATMLVSFHSPSPMPNARRRIGRLPSNSCALPSFFTVIGKLTSAVLPFSVSLPPTSSLPAPAARIFVAVNVAFGNCAALNHSFLRTSLL